jgi:hypothetical protein
VTDILVDLLPRFIGITLHVCARFVLADSTFLAARDAPLSQLAAVLVARSRNGPRFAGHAGP